MTHQQGENDRMTHGLPRYMESGHTTWVFVIGLHCRLPRERPAKNMIMQLQHEDSKFHVDMTHISYDYKVMIWKRSFLLSYEITTVTKQGRKECAFECAQTILRLKDGGWWRNHPAITLQSFSNFWPLPFKCTSCTAWRFSMTSVVAKQRWERSATAGACSVRGGLYKSGTKKCEISCFQLNWKLANLDSKDFANSSTSRAQGCIAIRCSRFSSAINLSIIPTWFLRPFPMILKPFPFVPWVCWRLYRCTIVANQLLEALRPNTSFSRVLTGN